MAVTLSQMPDIGAAKSTEEKLALLIDSYQKLRKDLEFALQNISVQNMDKSTSQIIKNTLTVTDIISNTVFNEYIDTKTEPSTVVITQTLTADKATIAELTVDQLDTSDKVRNYLNNDKSDVNYIKMFNQHIQFITASTTGTQTEQAKDRKGNKLYWTDALHTASTTEITSYPVMTYVYTELIKASIQFVLDNGNYVPKIILGVGDGVTTNSAKAEIYKGATGLEVNYYKSNTGNERKIKLTDDGNVVVDGDYKETPIIRNIIVTNLTPDVSMGNVNDIILKKKV